MPYFWQEPPLEEDRSSISSGAAAVLDNLTGEVLYVEVQPVVPPAAIRTNNIPVLPQWFGVSPNVYT